MTQYSHNQTVIDDWTHVPSTFCESFCSVVIWPVILQCVCCFRRLHRKVPDMLIYMGHTSSLYWMSQGQTLEPTLLTALQLQHQYSSLLSSPSVLLSPWFISCSQTAILSSSLEKITLKNLLQRLQHTVSLPFYKWVPCTLVSWLCIVHVKSYPGLGNLDKPITLFSETWIWSLDYPSRNQDHVTPNPGFWIILCHVRVIY